MLKSGNVKGGPGNIDDMIQARALPTVSNFESRQKGRMRDVSWRNFEMDFEME